jgi:hypothetical protein
VLRCILRHCGVPVSTPHSSGFARLEFEAFYFVVRFPTFYGINKNGDSIKNGETGKVVKNETSTGTVRWLKR